MAYEPKYTKPYTDGWKNFPEETTPITAEILNAIDTAMVASEEQLVATTEVFDEKYGSVRAGLKDKTINPRQSGIFGSLQEITGTVAYCLIAGYKNVVKSVSNIVGGTSNTINTNADYNIVGGNSNTVNDYSCGNVVAGRKNSVAGNYGVSGGNENVINAASSNVVGNGLKTYYGSNAGQHVGGNFNDPDENIDGSYVIFGIGNGTRDTARSNAMILDKRGNLQVAGKILKNGGEEIVSGAKQSAVYTNYSLAVYALNNAANTDFEAGQTIRLSEAGSPDLWIVSVATTRVSYSHEGTLVTDIKKTGTLQIGYYKVALVEADGFSPASITMDSHYAVVSALMKAGDAYFEGLKLAIGQTIHIKYATQADLYIYSKESTKASYSFAGDLEGDIIAAGGLLQVGYYKIGLVKGYVGALSYDDTLALLNAEEEEMA